MALFGNRNQAPGGYRDQGKEVVKGLLKLQIAATILIPLLFVADSRLAALSALCGGGIAAVATSLQATRFFRPYRAQNPGSILAVMVFSELMKMLVIGALFAVAFKVFDGIELLPMFTGFVVVYLTPFVAALMGASKEPKPH